MQKCLEKNFDVIRFGLGSWRLLTKSVVRVFITDLLRTYCVGVLVQSLDSHLLHSGTLNCGLTIICFMY